MGLTDSGLSLEQARAEAQAVADRDGVVMVVAFAPYGEWGPGHTYYPQAAASIFAATEKVVETIRPTRRSR